MSDGASEVIVIGGGIAGTAATLYLARAGMRVTLVESGEIAAQASGLNMGGLGGAGWGDPPDLQGYLTVGGLALFKELQIDLGYDIEFRQSGTLQAIQNEAEYEFARDRVLAGRAAGYDLELLSARDARAIEPALSPDLAGVVYSERMRGQADPVKTTRAFAEAAGLEGAEILTGREVTGLARRATGSFAVTTTDGEMHAQALVLAAGAWCRPLGEMLGLDIPIVAVRGQMWASEPLPPRIFHTISATASPLAWHRQRYAAPGLPPELTHHDDRRFTRHLYGRQNATGEVIFGGDRQTVGYDQAPDAAGIETNKAHAGEILPFLDRLPIKRSWAGLMPFSLDGRPLIGAIAQIDNLFIVGGLASSGFGRGPMAGKLLAELISTGHPAPCLADADPARCVTAS